MFTSWVTPDVISKSVIGRLTEKDLLLADLGYFDTAFLHQIQEKNFFISRIKINLKLYKAVSETYSI